MTRGERAAEIVLPALGFGMIVLTAIWPRSMLLVLVISLIAGAMLGKMLKALG